MVVAQIGCGLMGSALARILAREHDVIAWNRDPAKSEALAGAGIRPAESIEAAIGEASLAVISVTDYESAYRALEPVTDWSGTTAVNLCTGSPREAEEFARWAAERGLASFDGAILAYPADIGEPDALIAYSGPAELWQENAEALLPLAGQSRFVSEQIGGANVYDVALAGAFFNPAIGAFVEAVAYGEASGIGVEDMRAGSASMLALLRTSVDKACDAVAAGDFSTDQATLEIYEAAVRSWAQTMSEAGQRGRFCHAQLANMEDALAAGLGDEGFFAQHLTAGRDRRSESGS
jgi:3-hydroxyisobutyrate dehydrogenase-like beta-hydroxyacid dehydrogenase